MIVLAVMLAGGLGAATRFAVDGAVRARARTPLPLGTLAINLSGSFVLGVLVGLTTARVLPETWALVVGTGFLGGYTTFSAASVETVRLVQDRRAGLALGYGLGTLLATAAAAGGGLALGHAIG